MKYLTNRHSYIISLFLSILLLFPAFCLGNAGKNVGQKELFLWQIKSESATLYLLGSMHFASKELYPLDPAIESAFKSAETLVLELNPLTVNMEKTQRYVQTHGFYGKNDSLLKHIEPETLTMLENYLIENKLPFQDIYSMRPGMLAITISARQLQNLGYQPEYGIDLHFAQKAMNTKTIIELETMQEQLDMLFSMPNNDNFLQYTLRDLENLEQTMELIINAWNQGDQNTLYEQLLQPYLDEKEMRPILRRLFYNRNIKMAAKLKKMLRKNGTYFVVVGAGHLLGDHGLLSLLSDRRNVISQVTSEENNPDHHKSQ